MIRKKRTIDGGCMRLAKIVLTASVICLLAFLIIGELIYPDERDISNNCRLYEADWYRLDEHGNKTLVEWPGKIEVEYAEEITLTSTLPNTIVPGESLCFRLIWQDASIYVDGKLRTSYTTKDTRPYGKNSAFRYVFLDLEKDDAGKELTYIFSSDSKYSGTLMETYIGDKDAIWATILSRTGPKTIIALFLFLLSVFCIIVCIILKWGYKIDLALNYLAWTLFFCSLWMLSEMEVRQLFVKNVSVITGSTYWSLMIIPLPLFIYINEIQNRRYQKIFMVPIVYSCSILVISTVLQVFDVVQFVDQLPAIHAGDLIAVICVTTTLILDTVRGKIKDYLVIGIGIYGMIFTSVMEIVLYYLDTTISLGTIFAAGLLFLLIMAIIKTGQDLFVSEKKRQQAIAARESQAKFLANMSHEIRTPINAVIGMNEMILRECSDKGVIEYANNISSATNLLLDLVNKILDFSKIEAGQLELMEDSYDFSLLIREQISLLKSRACNKPISIITKVNPNMPKHLYGDEIRIKQIVTNLLSNAVKYTREGNITLEVECRFIEKKVIEIIMSVIDTGIGIKKEDQPQLFESFKRFDLVKNRNVEGSGLGLNIVKQLIDLMNGSITVESEYGKGSKFTVTIPQRVMDNTPMGNVEAAIEETDKDNNEKAFFRAPWADVLVVDDNAMNLSLMKNLLKRTEMKVDLASSGKQCLELTDKKRYDIIFMDHMMPELDGIETLKLLRKNVINPNRNTKVIALTANAIAGSREMYLTNGFNDYLSKPKQKQRQRKSAFWQKQKLKKPKKKD